MQRYSIVIQPSPKVIVEVKQMKEVLATKIGWYNSKNSLAHITVNEFEVSETELENVKKQITSITNFLHSNEVKFDSFNSFPNGAFFLAPDEESKAYLKEIMQKIHQSFKYKTAIKSTEPHISIGRRLSPENLSIAFSMLDRPEISFLCDRLALRVFNEQRKQFDVVEEFVFKGKERDDIQGELF